MLCLLLLDGLRCDPALLYTVLLYALLGVIEDDNASVGSNSVENRSTRSGASAGVAASTKGDNSGVPITGAKILAKSLKEQYAPVLGTLKETADTIIMYR